VIVPVVLLAFRLPLESLVSDRAPYAFNFVAVLIAAVLAGWRSGLLALVIGQFLTWYAVVEPQWSFAIEGMDRLWGLILASFSQAMVLLIIGLYQREVDKGVAERERRLEVQEHARREIDHRLRNNFQTVLALIRLQEQRSRDSAAQQALSQVGERLKAISTVTELLAMRSEDLATVSIRDHLCDLCTQLEQALADGIPVHCDVPEVHAGAVEATYLGIIVNELVTNSIKHAFADGRSGWVRVEGEANGRAFELVVRDNGSGMKGRAERSGSGLGQKLVKTFVRELGAKHELSTSKEGTTHRIKVPELVK
jgi:two-component sensor histidine kinase